MLASSTGRGLMTSRLSYSEGCVPIGHRILRLAAMRDVRVVTDGITLGNRGAELGEAHADLRTENDAGQPRGSVLEDAEKLIHPLAIEALRRNPHLRLWMVAVEYVRFFGEERHQVPGLGVARIAARDEDGV